MTEINVIALLVLVPICVVLGRVLYKSKRAREIFIDILRVIQINF